jgi:uroporphyrinogen-III synthase
MADEPLTGCRILVTRPAHQAHGLTAAIEREGGEALGFPTIEIGPPSDPGVWEAMAPGLEALDWLIFISANAVERFARHLEASGRGWPAAPRFAAIGRKTAEALRQRGGPDPLVPADFRSESFLELPEMAADAVAGRRVLIISGEGGRELLPRTLSDRGAEVARLPVYARRAPDASPAPVAEALADGSLSAAVFTSPEGFTNLLGMLGPEARQNLTRVPLVAISPVTARAIRDQGFPEPVVAPEATDEGLVQGLISVCSAANPTP